MAEKLVEVDRCLTPLVTARFIVSWSVHYGERGFEVSFTDEYGNVWSAADRCPLEAMRIALMQRGESKRG